MLCLRQAVFLNQRDVIQPGVLTQQGRVFSHPQVKRCQGVCLQRLDKWKIENFNIQRLSERQFIYGTLTLPSLSLELALVLHCHQFGYFWVQCSAKYTPETHYSVAFHFGWIVNSLLWSYGWAGLCSKAFKYMCRADECNFRKCIVVYNRNQWRKYLSVNHHPW